MRSCLTATVHHIWRYSLVFVAVNHTGSTWMPGKCAAKEAAEARPGHGRNSERGLIAAEETPTY
jgi:hypothetical protein